MSDDLDEERRAGTKPPRNRDDDKAAPPVQLATSCQINPDRILTDLRGYWDGLRKGRAVPDRADVEPKGIQAALDYAFILERIAPGAARFRLAGRHLVDLMGMEVRGMPVCSLFNPDSRGRFSDVLETVFKGPQIAELSMRSASAYGRPTLSARMLFLPLRSDLGDVTRALGCLICRGPLGRAPRRFDLVGDSIFPVIEGARALPPSAHGFGEDPLPWRPPVLQRPVIRQQRGDETPEERRARFRVIGNSSPES